MKSITNIVSNFRHYWYLMTQLITRDFKRKYKRSVLGVLWSLLYPILMMSVMAIVFSQMFRFKVEGINYLVYLLTGIIMFQYFSEASNSAMTSVVENAALINKVYIPKYIFPLSKCLFVGINFILTLIPWTAIILLTQFGLGTYPASINWYYLILPYIFLCLFMFTVGMVVKKLAVHTNNTMETIYKKLIWPLYKTHKHALDALKEILAGNTSILDGLKVDENIKEELMKILKEKLVPQPLKIRADFKLTCYTFEGIDAIKEALMNGEKKGTEKIPIKFTILGSPLYECSLTAINKEEGINLMNQALEEVKNSIKAKGGSYLLETKPMVLGEGEKSLAEQLKEAKNKEKEDEEGEEEENEEDNEEGIKANLPQFDANEFQISKDKK